MPLIPLYYPIAGRGGGGRYVTLTGDTTDLETTEKWEGAGSVVREERIKDKNGKWVSIEVIVHGFKLGTMWDSESGIPLAGKVESIEVHDHEYLAALYDQAKANLTSTSTSTSTSKIKMCRCQITKLLLDRGFLDGNFLYERDKEGVIFVIVARNNMIVYQDAHQLAKAILKDGKGEGYGFIQERKETIVHGRGKNQTSEEVRTKVVGIRSLRTYDAYTSLEEYQHKNRKDFAPQPISAHKRGGSERIQDGIFHIAEFAILMGANFSKDFFYELPEEVGNRQDIFRRYCIQRE